MLFPVFVNFGHSGVVGGFLKKSDSITGEMKGILMAVCLPSC